MGKYMVFVWVSEEVPVGWLDDVEVVEEDCLRMKARRCESREEEGISPVNEMLRKTHFQIVAIFGDSSKFHSAGEGG